MPEQLPCTIPFQAVGDFCSLLEDILALSFVLMNFFFSLIVFFLLFCYCCPFWAQERALVGIWELRLLLSWHSPHIVTSGVGGAFGCLASSAVNHGSLPTLPTPRVSVEYQMTPVEEHAGRRCFMGHGEDLGVEIPVVKF